MTTVTDLVTQVAEARKHPETCDDRCNCGESPLRWPTLSRECPVCLGTRRFQSHLIHDIGTCRSCETGRVPDVTLEKVQSLLLQKIGSAKFDFCSDETYTIFWVKDEIANAVVGNTPLEAAIAALLAT